MDELNVGKRLEQNLRENLIFGLFATDDAKEDLKWIKEEELKRKFKHFWVVQFCNFVKYYNEVNEENEFELEKECSQNSSNSALDIVKDLTDKGYDSLACKIVKSMFQDLDLVITDLDIH